MSGIKHWPKLFLFGDSLTQQGLSKDGCWVSLVGDFFIRRCDLILRGFSGYNTRHCKYVLPKVLDETIAKDVAALTIFLGANDATDGEKNPAQSVPLEEYKANLKQMVDYCLSLNIPREKIIVISPPTVDVVEWEKEVIKKGNVLSRDNSLTAKYATASLNVAKDTGVTGIDLFGEMMKSEDFTKYLSDGLHLAEDGSQLLFELLRPVLEKCLSDVPPLIFPDWKMLDNKNPEPCFQDW